MCHWLITLADCQSSAAEPAVHSEVKIILMRRVEGLSECDARLQACSFASIFAWISASCLDTVSSFPSPHFQPEPLMYSNITGHVSVSRFVFCSFRRKKKKTKKNKPSCICAAVVVFFLSCLLVTIKWCQAYKVQSLRPNKRLRQHSVYKKKRKSWSYFSLGHEGTKGRLNLQMNYLYQSPHQLFHNLLYFLNVLNGTVLYCKYLNIFCFILYCSLYLALI